MCSFVPQIELKSVLDKNTVEAVKEFCKKIIDKCARKYGFDAQEAFDYLKIDDLSLKENKKGKKEKKEKKPVALKPRFNLPFCGTKIDGYCCGLKYNARLFTQCMNEPIIHGLCKACNKEKEKTPNLELITKRIEMGDDFVDQLGRKPMHYSVYMEKNRLSKEEVIEEGAKFGIRVDENHLNKLVKEKKTKKAGRPQKKATIVEVNEIEEVELEETVEEEKDLFMEAEEEVNEIEEVELEETVEEEKELFNNEIEFQTPNLNNDEEEEEEKEEEEEEEEDEEKEEERIRTTLVLPPPVFVEKKADKEKVDKKAEKERKEAEKKAEKERKEAEKKAEKERKEAEKKAEKELKEAEKKAGKEKKSGKEKKETNAKKTVKESYIEENDIITDELTNESYSKDSEEEEEEEEVELEEYTMDDGRLLFKDNNSNKLFDKKGEDDYVYIGQLVNGILVSDEDDVETDDEDN